MYEPVRSSRLLRLWVSSLSIGAGILLLTIFVVRHNPETSFPARDYELSQNVSQSLGPQNISNSKGNLTKQNIGINPDKKVNPSSVSSGRDAAQLSINDVVEGAIENVLLTNHSRSATLQISSSGDLLIGGVALKDYKTGDGRKPLKNKRWYVQKAWHYKSKRLEKAGYKSLDDMEPYRMPSVVALSRRCEDRKKIPFVLQFSKVFMDNYGRIYVPRKLPVPFGSRVCQKVDLYDIQGGIAENQWARQKGKFLRVNSLSTANVTIALSLAQHHGSSYHHTLHEAVARLLYFWRIIDAARAAEENVTIGLVVEKSSVTKDVLRILGFPDERVRVILLRGKERRFFSRILVLAPFLQDGYDSRCYDRTTSDLLKQIVMKAFLKKPPVAALPSNNATRVVVLMIERARKRYVNSKGKSGCDTNRCLTNFNKVRDILRKELGDVIDLRVLAPKGNSLVKSIEQFQAAQVVIGVHGAAFQNMMFMNPDTDALHLGWREPHHFYTKVARWFKIHFTHIITPGARQNSRRIRGNVDVILFELRRILKRLNVTYPPPQRVVLKPKQVKPFVQRYPASL
eukprot:Plantae.Rhodophyta-Hildenbrandia_rubra.ctg22928.p1 GENE.Plantae.Rhodophyta-Hildenbrandia_rubra.ctg22928~~Plantae.Rhodophyta-Hildenbrandia_rubra.ctg22928.p1  ORF type:complete len:570 (-),score=70.74 Plantae.Rhodophyta-Hildenbrandia_rubra.ctg22928:284-1993(-)